MCSKPLIVSYQTQHFFGWKRLIKHIFLSPLGDLGIGLVWDNHQPIPRLFPMSVEIFLKMNITNYDGFISSGDHLGSTEGHAEIIDGSLISFCVI